MDATITLVRSGVTQAQVDQVVTLAHNAGWTVTWSTSATVAVG